MNKKTIAIVLAIIATSTLAFMPALARADTQIQTLGIKARGLVTNWGNDTAFGWIDAVARLINNNGTKKEWAGVQALWSLDKPRLNCTRPPTENVTFIVYTARLTNSSLVSLNYSDYNFYISGTWNVNKITTSIYVNENGTFLYAEKTIERQLTDAQGELRVSQNWMRFELAIEGIPALSGFVVFHRIAYVEIKLCDLDDDGKVDLVDIIRVAKAWRAVPGTPRYSVDADFNFDCEINLPDLTTLAANIEV